MRIDFLPQGARSFRANLHCHSTLSDGALTPEQLASFYKLHGYSIVAFSDHNRLVPHPELAQPDFLPLTACEIDFKGSHRGTLKACHLNCIARDANADCFPKYKGSYNWDNITTTARRFREAGFLVALNHPYWSAQSPKELSYLNGLIYAMEVYNHMSEVFVGSGRSDIHWDYFLRQGNRAGALSTDDNHRAPKDGGVNDMFGGFTGIFAHELSYDAIISALEQGHFYASTGPEVYAYYLDGDYLCVECSPIAVALLKGNCFATMDEVISRKQGMTSIRFNLTPGAKGRIMRTPDPEKVEYLRGDNPFVRVELIDAQGRKAWLNSCYFAESSVGA